MTKTLIIFDIDGTLVYSNRIDSQCFADTYEALYGLPFPTIDWRTYPHVTDTTIFASVIRQHFQREPGGEEVYHFQNHFVARIKAARKEKPQEFKEVPFARQTIHRLLDDERFVVGIATGGWQGPALVKLAHVGIPAERLVISCADGKTTREDIIKEVVGKVTEFHASISQIVYVGDAVWDVHTTRRLQMKFVGIRREGDFDVLHREGTSVVLQDYSNYEMFLEAVSHSTPPR
jgi:phosphoglycolate phosphatase-like HAD superfamily hydrolase